MSAVPVDRGTWFRWLAERPPYARILTQEECHVLAREADSAREIEFRARDVLVSVPNLPEHYCIDRLESLLYPKESA